VSCRSAAIGVNVASCSTLTQARSMRADAAKHQHRRPQQLNAMGTSEPMPLPHPGMSRPSPYERQADVSIHHAQNQASFMIQAQDLALPGEPAPAQTDFMRCRCRRRKRSTPDAP